MIRCASGAIVVARLGVEADAGGLELIDGLGAQIFHYGCGFLGQGLLDLCGGVALDFDGERSSGDEGCGGDVTSWEAAVDYYVVGEGEVVAVGVPLGLPLLLGSFSHHEIIKIIKSRTLLLLLL